MTLWKNLAARSSLNTVGLRFFCGNSLISTPKRLIESFIYISKFGSFGNLLHHSNSTTKPFLFTKVCKVLNMSTLTSLAVDNKKQSMHDVGLVEDKINDGQNLTSQTSSYNPTSTILRYSLGDERFELKVTLPKGKVCNFDRAINEPLQSCIERMTTNISKKVKTFEGKVVFFWSLTLKSNTKEEKAEWEELPNTMIIADLLLELVNDSKRLKIQIGEDTYDVALNPPEIYSIKFLKEVMAEYPVVPIKFETSSNFKMDCSKYVWEYTTEALLKRKPSKKSDKKRKKSVGVEVEELKQEIVEETSIWTNSGCNDFVFIPQKELIGVKLRFTCFPSNGKGFGLPFSVDFPSEVTQSVIQNPLFEERLNRMKKKPLDNEKFTRVVSYNCLADCYATEEWFISSPKGCLSADFRLPFLNKELATYDGDLYCLQEVDEKYFEGYFSPFFSHYLQYKGVFSSKIGNTKEGIATFYNPRKFDMLRNETVVILEHMKTQSFWNSISSLNEDFLNRLLDRNTVFQLTIFKPKAIPNSIMIVANTHLYFHPDADHIRCLQTITCIDYIETTVKEIKKTFPTFQVSVLFCGDFNCTPPFSSYRFLTLGKIDEDDFDWTSHSIEKLLPGVKRQHNLNFKSAHPGEELTNITTCFEGCLDYILYQPEHFNLLCSYPAPDKSLIASIIGVDETRKVSLPNFHTPSDHLPIISDFELKSTHS